MAFTGVLRAIRNQHPACFNKSPGYQRMPRSAPGPEVCLDFARQTSKELDQGPSLFAAPHLAK
jgi:hypothetical protein